MCNICFIAQSNMYNVHTKPKQSQDQSLGSNSFGKCDVNAVRKQVTHYNRDNNTN